MKTAFVGIAGARIHYRDTGAGSPLVFLHGGWGYEVYPFDRQIEALGGRYRIIIPDRTGYGRSPRITSLPPNFHRLAAVETIQVLDALQIERAVLWGHSDGAVIAALLGLAAPGRFSGLILEAFHYTRSKTGSVDFFREMISEPYKVGNRAAAALARDHGEDWRGVVERNAAAWLEIVASSPGDLYGGKLSELAVPALFIHGSRDPRTEPGDLEAIRRELPGAEMRIIEGAAHSPHSEAESSEECMRIAEEFLVSVGQAGSLPHKACDFSPDSGYYWYSAVSSELFPPLRVDLGPDVRAGLHAAARGFSVGLAHRFRLSAFRRQHSRRIRSHAPHVWPASIECGVHRF